MKHSPYMLPYVKGIKYNLSYKNLHCIKLSVWYYVKTLFLHFSHCESALQWCATHSVTHHAFKFTKIDCFIVILALTVYTELIAQSSGDPNATVNLVQNNQEM